MRKLNVLVACLFLAGCSREQGDRPLLRGHGYGYDWTSEKPESVFRVSVQNSFTRDVYVALDGGGTHYELCVGPITEGYMIVPKKDYKYSAWPSGGEVGGTKFEVIGHDVKGAKGVLIRIRP